MSADVSSDVETIRAGIPVLTRWEHDPMCQTTFGEKGLPCNCQVARSDEARAALDRLAARAAGRENVTEAARDALAWIESIPENDEIAEEWAGVAATLRAALDEAGEGAPLNVQERATTPN